MHRYHTPTAEGLPTPSNEVVVSLDTISIFFECNPRGLDEAMAAFHGRYSDSEQHRKGRGKKRIKRRFYIAPCRNGGWHLRMHGPFKKETIEQVARWQSRYDGVVCQLHIAYDFPSHAYRYILTHAILRNRRAGPMKDFREPNSPHVHTYWNWDEELKHRFDKNLLLYWRASKITGKDVSHFEINLLTPRACAREGLEQVRALLTLNPGTLFMNNVAWSDAGDRLVKANQDHNRHNPRLFEKIPHIMQRGGTDRAQWVKDSGIMPVRSDSLLCLPEDFNIPDSLTWEAMRQGSGPIKDTRQTSTTKLSNPFNRAAINESTSGASFVSDTDVLDQEANATDVPDQEANVLDGKQPCM
jgi:hypothetical protein